MSTTQTINDEAARNLAANRTACKRTVWLPLLGKEAKQLAPLLAVLAGCGVFLHLLGLTQRAPGGYHATILALIPVLFAVGVGPILVSQEKEQRTLRWMVSLPVPPRSIVISKLIASLLGLIVIWCISLAVTFAFCPSVLSTTSNVDFELLFWPGNTFFLMLMGFALAWILPTAGSTLVAFLVLASAAGVFAVLANDASNVDAALYGRVEFLVYLLSSYAVVTVVLAVVAIQLGKKSFVTEAKSKSSFAWVGNREQTRLTVDRTRTPSLSPASSLIWQVGWQNRMLWVGASFVLLMISASLAYGLGFLDSRELLEFTPAAGCLVLSWLGASAFGSDARQGRIRFLAERGVAPSKIWWTRLALPFGNAILGVLAFLLLIKVWNFLHESHSRELRLNWTLDGQLVLRGSNDICVYAMVTNVDPQYVDRNLRLSGVSNLCNFVHRISAGFHRIALVVVNYLDCNFICSNPSHVVPLDGWPDGVEVLAGSKCVASRGTYPAAGSIFDHLRDLSRHASGVASRAYGRSRAVRALQSRSRISKASDPRK